MERYFNTAGPVREDWHYLLPPLSRWDMDEVTRLIAQGKYFVLHAPRQTGKTSALLALMKKINIENQYYCTYANIEAVQALRHDVKEGILTICQIIASDARDYTNNHTLMALVKKIRDMNSPASALTEFLAQWVKQSNKPVVLLLDEVDALIGDVLIAVLRQLRAGYTKRPFAFPLSIIICGVRDVRDYRIHTQDKEIITGGSAFNIKAASLRLGNFNANETKQLLQQHTVLTGQKFTTNAINYIYQQTQGQPWLVNALAYEVCFNIPMGRNRNHTVTVTLFKEAREILIQRREVHLDQLADKLKEPRVHRVIVEILQDNGDADNFHYTDTKYVKDLGLISIQQNGKLGITNPIYQEIIPRELSWGWQMGIEQQQIWYLDNQNHLNMMKLMQAFQTFFRKNSKSWIQRFDYHEAGPQLLMQAFLQRIINGGGRIEREYGLGRRRTDLFIEWPINKKEGFYGKVQTIVIELKIKYGSLNKTIKKGLKQTSDYMDECDTKEGHLVIFNRNKKVKWKQKIFQQQKTYADYTIHVWGM